MKIGGSISAFNISAKGLSVQRKKMNMISENLANANTIRSENGGPYQRKVLNVVQKKPLQVPDINTSNIIKLKESNEDHFIQPLAVNQFSEDETGLEFKQVTDKREGDIVYMPDHPDADEDGYVRMSNVNVITEMTDMIAATRTYEANLVAFNSSKQIAKDSLDI
ncbi:MAG TPA: flagellar basal body rod protein FlgC [Ignavibacteriaceae bacterium]|nr:flagellar basal body rod protein FlgC [Ignavibacteriaceae bacterium]